TLPIPTSIRFHHDLLHRPSNSSWPAMIALVTDVESAPIAIHRTWLARDGRDTAPIEPQRMARATCRGGAVRLGGLKADRWLLIAEGIETGLTVMHSEGVPAWCALSATGIKNLELPPEAMRVVLCADNDANGKGQEAVDEAGQRFVREGRTVHIASPPETDTDWNDVLRARGADYAER